MTLKEAETLLREAGIDDAKYDAREIFRAIGGFSPAALLIGAETGDPAVLDAIKRRAAREPLGYILGEVGFFGNSFFVTPDVLIPRPDTETLVEAVLSRLPAGAKFIDLCTGSGCIALSVLAHTKDTAATALDVSPAALLIAEKNAGALGLSDRVSFVLSDVLSDGAQTGPFDAVISNPPYVDDGVYPTLSPEVLAEPKIAFVGGPDGMDFYRAIVKNYRDTLSPRGFIAFEIGYDQRQKITEIAGQGGFSCEIIRDLGGNDRVAVLRKS